MAVTITIVGPAGRKSIAWHDAGSRSMRANPQWCRQNADQPRGATADHPGAHSRSPTAAVALPLAPAHCPTTADPPQVGIGPKAAPERKSPTSGAGLSACTTENFLWLPDLGSNQGPTD